MRYCMPGCGQQTQLKAFGVRPTPEICSTGTLPGDGRLAVFGASVAGSRTRRSGADEGVRPYIALAQRVHLRQN